MKIRKLLIIPMCIVTCLMMSGCTARNISRLMRIGYNLTEKEDKKDGSIIESDLSPVVTVDNYVDYLVYTDYIDFGKEIETTYVKMTILDASVGSDYENTCVSEVKFIKY